MKEKTVCFSGHRPEKLPLKGDPCAPQTRMLISLIYNEIFSSVAEGYDTFITGVAKGIDLWAGSLVADMKNKNSDIKLISAVPYVGYGESWKGLDRWNLRYILNKSDCIHYVCKEYNRGCMRQRNEYMVNNSSKLIAVASDYRSGTGQTIRYAKSKNLEIKIIDPFLHI